MPGKQAQRGQRDTRSPRDWALLRTQPGRCTLSAPQHILPPGHTVQHSAGGAGKTGETEMLNKGHLTPI